MSPTTQKKSQEPSRRILLYGDVNLNVMDGSAVWLVSMAEVLSRTNSLVDVMLKTPIHNDRLVKKLTLSDGVRFIAPPTIDGEEVSLSPRIAAQRMLALHLANNYDIIIARGFQICQFVAGSEKMAEKSWLYVTDLPFPRSSMSEQKQVALEKIAVKAKRLFAQTEDARAYLESIIPAAAGKTILLPPMIPDEFYTTDYDLPVGKEVRLVYAGKFAKNWRTLEMCGLARELHFRGIEAEVELIGDKFQDDAKDPSWPQRMRQAVEGEGVTWLGGMSREDTIAVVGQAHIGLGWRDASLDSSLEISTKALEYAATGVCPLINRTAAHERLFGEDYPFFIEKDDLGHVATLIADSLDMLPEVRKSVRLSAQHYSIQNAAKRLEDAFHRAGVGEELSSISGESSHLKVVLAGHDFKFAGELVELLKSDKSVELRIDEWATLHKHDENISAELVEWADVVICEWAGPNAVWYSENKRDGQALVVRLHAFELRGAWIKNIVQEAVDALVCVSSHYKQMTHAVTSWPLDKIAVIPNAVDQQDLDRPKQKGANFRLGLVGMVPFIKRPDRALDLLEELLLEDSRYMLHIRGRMPWEYSYEWGKPLQQQAYMEFFGRIGASEELRSHVVFEPFGADMGSWLSKIGFVLSPSTRESFHLAPAEGMASGAIPVFWDRPGVREIFGEDYVVADVRDAALRVQHLSSNLERYSSEASAVKVKAGEFDLMSVRSQWADVLRCSVVKENNKPVLSSVS